MISSHGKNRVACNPNPPENPPAHNVTNQLALRSSSSEPPPTHNSRNDVLVFGQAGGNAYANENDSGALGRSELASTHARIEPIKYEHEYK